MVQGISLYNLTNCWKLPVSETNLILLNKINFAWFKQECSLEVAFLRDVMWEWFNCELLSNYLIVLFAFFGGALRNLWLIMRFINAICYHYFILSLHSKTGHGAVCSSYLDVFPLSFPSCTPSAQLCFYKMYITFNKLSSVLLTWQCKLQAPSP